MYYNKHHMVFGSLAKMAAKGVAKKAKSELRDSRNQMISIAKNRGQQAINGMKQNAITYGTIKLNQAQARVSNRMGAIKTGLVQNGQPIMQGPNGGNFRLGPNGQRLPVL